MTVFIVFMILILPHILDNAFDEWERLSQVNIPEEELRAMFLAHPAYMAMYERFPDAKEEFSYREGGGDTRMTVGVMNFENNNQLILNMYYYDRESEIKTNIRCNTTSHNGVATADGLFVEGFIQNTNCLESIESDNNDDNGDKDRSVETRESVITVPAP